jgi:hypothetical protein
MAACSKSCAAPITNLPPRRSNALFDSLESVGQSTVAFGRDFLDFANVLGAVDDRRRPFGTSAS